MEKTFISLGKDDVVEFENGVIINNEILELLRWLQFGYPDSNERNYGINDILEMLHFVGDLIMDLKDKGEAEAESILLALDILKIVRNNYEQFEIECEQEN